MVVKEDEIYIDGRRYNVFYLDGISNIPLIVIKAKNGYLANSMLSFETAEKVGDLAVFVNNVKKIEDMAKAKVRKHTSWAGNLGIKEGTSAKRALELLDKGRTN
ncbi:MAG: DUF1805 domain-containing protein [Candidatus Anstonellales archaeon]